MIHLDILPPPQRAFWEEDVPSLPPGWVLYGGTAIALHLGHQQSVDFDFFSGDPLDRNALRSNCAALGGGKEVREKLVRAVAAYDPHTPPARRLSNRLD